MIRLFDKPIQPVTRLLDMRATTYWKMHGSIIMLESSRDFPTRNYPETINPKSVRATL